MDFRRKAVIDSLVILAISIIISVIVYYVFHIVFIFLIFIPPVIYHFLMKRASDDTKENSDRFGNPG
jgi:hypothetical protein